MKKQLLVAAALLLFGYSSGFAQQFKVGKEKGVLSAPNKNKLERCSTPDPDEQWSLEFEKLVQQYKVEHTDATGKLASVNYTIPVIVHIIHSGEAVGSGTNISAAQVADQIRILNEDYAGIGLSSNNVPYAFNGLKADCNIRFCLATKDEAGNTLAEPGIDRVAASSIPVTVPGTGLSKTTIDGTIKPATIWDPVKYCNMWVLKLDQTLLGYATFPLSSTLTGIPTGSTGSSTTDGLVMGYDYFGSIGAASGSAPYNKGRTTTHEIGHWLGLRHIWGDNGQCGATDYAVDTPPQKGGTAAPAGSNYGAPTGGYNGYPFQPSTCTRNDGTAGASVTNTHGDMFMNFMDYTNDIAMYMFTNDQRTRIQTAMANGTFRKFLGTHSLCTSSGVAAAAPIAGFDWERTIAVTSAAVCNGVAVNFKDASRNYPTSWAWSTNPSTGVTINSSSSQNPQITFANSGTYTVTLVATNAVNSNTKTRVITVNACASSAPSASFSIASSGCTNSSIATTNTSTGNPTPTYQWSSSPSTGVTFSSSTTTAPTVSFANIGTYTITLVATNSNGSQNAQQVVSITDCSLVQCDTLSNIPDTSSIVLYTTSGGYLSGNNQYGDTHKGEYFTQTGISGNRVTGMIAYFFKNGNNGTGGAAGGNMAFQLYTGNNTTGPSGAAVKSDNVTLGTIASGGIAAGTILAYTHTFSSPYVLTSNEIHAVVQLPTSTGDTVALYSRILNVPTVNTAWEKASNGVWSPYTSTAAWNQKGALALFPIVCPNSVGLASSTLNTQVAIYPNPSTGVINFAFALANQSDVKIEVTNILGQTVYSSLEKAVSADIKSIDLGDVSKGVYLVTISTSTEKMVRKIIID